MQVFHIRGLSGLAVMIVSFTAIVAAVLLIPASFMMVLWNATVFEGLNGPEIDLYQGLLLWLASMIAIKLIFKPEIQIQFQHMSTFQKNQKPAPTPQKTEEEEAPSSALLDE